MAINILQERLLSNVSFLIGQLWNLSQSQILKPYQIQKEIDLIHSLKGWMKNRNQRMLLWAKHTLTNKFCHINVLIESYWLISSLESQRPYFSIFDPDLVSIKFPGKTPLGETWASCTSSWAVSIRGVLCMQESRIWPKDNKWAVNDRSPVVHRLLPASSFLSPPSDLGFPIGLWGFPIYA